jgi:hypothetical protein
MDSLTLLLLLLIITAFVLILKSRLFPSTSIKSSAVKKSEIIQTYEKQMQTLLKNYAHDEVTCKQQKMIFLKSVSAQLHKNIFFEEEEIKHIIQKLASL